MRARKLKAGKIKTTGKKHSTKAKNPTQVAREKWRLAVQRCKEINKQWKAKFDAKTREFKHKIAEVANSAYVKAVETVANETRRKFEAKAKAFAAAEAKVEKKFAKLLGKKTKRTGKTTRHTQAETHPSSLHATTTKVKGKKRGRKSMKHHVTTQHAVTTTHQTGKKGKKGGRKATLNVAGHRTTTTSQKRRGRLAKGRAHGLTRTTYHRATAR